MTKAIGMPFNTGHRSVSAKVGAGAKREPSEKREFRNSYVNVLR